MSDQADQLRVLVRQAVAAEPALAPGPTLITCTAAGKAAGATSLVCTLAAELARLGRRLALVDANFEGPAIRPDLFAANRKPVRPTASDAGSNIAHILSGARRAAEVLQPLAPAVQLIPGCRGPAPRVDAAALAHFRTELTALSRECDVVLIDAGAGMNPWVDRLWQLSSLVLLVTTPQDQSILNAFAAVKNARYEHLTNRLQVVINQVEDQPGAEAAANRFDSACRRFLGLQLRPAALAPLVPSAASQPSAAPTYVRAVRLLAADIAAELNACAVRLPRVPQNAGAPQGTCEQPQPADVNSVGIH